MSFTIELSPDEDRTIQSARQRGIDVEKLLRDTIRKLDGARSTVSEDPTISLFREWREEDVTDDPEELARRTEELDELLASLRTNRLSLNVPGA